jgi:signal transduction histidine kinase
MARPVRGRFARRLALWFALLGLGTAALTAVLVNVAFTVRFRDYLDSVQQGRAEQLAAAFAADYARDGGWRTASLDQLAPSVSMAGAEAVLLDSAGAQVWSLDQSGQMSMSGMMGQGEGSLGPMRAVPVEVGGVRVGTVQVRVPQGQIPAVDQDFRDSVNWLLALGALTAAVAAGGVGTYLARRATAPICELTAAADDLAAGRRERRAAVGSRDEIGRLAASFNAMADQVEKQDELHRVFAADVAHELRTPLAIIRSQLEAIQDGVHEPTPQAIDSLHEEALRLGRLIADLELLAAAEAAVFTLERSLLSLTAVVREAVDAYAGRFSAAGLDLETVLDEVRFDGDAVRLRQILGNLLDNTLKYVPSGAAVRVVLRGGPDRIRLTVADTGPGIPAEELPRIFERFYRGAAARTGGSGIGLAVVAGLVSAHGGRITAASTPGEGTALDIDLPTAGAP